MNLPDLNGWAAAQWAPCMVRACWQGALAVAGVWIICRLFPRLPPALRAALWWIACLKTVASLVVVGPLRLPVLPAGPPLLAAATFTPSTVTAIASAATSSPIPAGTASITDTKLPAAPLAVAPVEESLSRSESISPVGIALCIWLAGVSFLLAVGCLDLRSVRRLAEQAHPCDEPTTAGEISCALGLRHSPPVLVSERADCSLVIGPWRPVVVLCRADLKRLSSPELRALLAHELAHVRRCDLWAGILPNLARILFFFHPLVWLACREYDLAREAACDAEALRVTGIPPAAYGRLLLKLGITSGSAVPPCSNVAALGAASPHGVLLHRRLKSLQGLGSGLSTLPRWTVVLTLVLVVGILSLHPVRVGAVAVPDAPPARVYRSNAPNNSPSVTTAHEPSGQTPRNIRTRSTTTTYEASLPVSLPLARTSLTTASPAEGNVLAKPPTSDVDQNNKKEDSPMLSMSNLRKPKLSTTFAALAATGTPTLFAATPAVAQEVPATPAVPAIPAVPATPVPPVTPVSPVTSAASEALADAQAAATAQAPRYQFTFRRGNSYMNRTPDNAVGSAQRTLAKAQPGDCLVVDRDGKRYLITDAATLQRVRENYAPVDAIGKQMEALGRQMEDIGKPMDALGKQMDAFGKQMEGIGKQMEEQGKLLEAAFNEQKPEAERQAIQEKMRALQDQMKVPQKEMRDLSQKMRDQGSKMRPISDQMREQGKQIRAAVKEADERMNGIIDAAFQNNLAVEQKTP